MLQYNNQSGVMDSHSEGPGGSKKFVSSTGKEFVTREHTIGQQVELSTSIFAAKCATNEQFIVIVEAEFLVITKRHHHHQPNDQPSDWGHYQPSDQPSGW